MKYNNNNVNKTYIHMEYEITKGTDGICGAHARNHFLKLWRDKTLAVPNCRGGVLTQGINPYPSPSLPPPSHSPHPQTGPGGVEGEPGDGAGAVGLGPQQQREEASGVRAGGPPDRVDRVGGVFSLFPRKHWGVVTYTSLWNTCTVHASHALPLVGPVTIPSPFAQLHPCLTHAGGRASQADYGP